MLAAAVNSSRMQHSGACWKHALHKELPALLCPSMQHIDREHAGSQAYTLQGGGVCRQSYSLTLRSRALAFAPLDSRALRAGICPNSAARCKGVTPCSHAQGIAMPVYVCTPETLAGMPHA